MATHTAGLPPISVYARCDLPSSHAHQGAPMISHIKFVGIPVKDQDRALDFYVSRLGFKVHTDQPMGDGPGAQRWIELRTPKGETGVALFTPQGHEDRVGTFSGIS